MQPRTNSLPDARALRIAIVLIVIALETSSGLAVEPESARLVLVGRLAFITETPHCGGFHFGAVAVYTELTVLEGSYSKEVIQVVHACPELSRGDYAPQAGDLKRFVVGDYHRMTLVPIEGIDIAVVEAKELPKAERWYCRKVDMWENQ